MEVNLFWHSYDYFPYEKDFATREIESVFSDVENLQSNGDYVRFSTSDNGEVSSKIERLTYFREGHPDNNGRLIPTQAKLEAVSENGGLEVGVDNEPRCPKLSRQQTRYSAHGIHEYKGKFNPQVVRALGNIIGMENGDWLLDPFSGSGTTLLEAAHNGWNAIGVEINPLAVAISNAKIHSLNASTDHLETIKDEIDSALTNHFSGVDLDEEFTQTEVEALTVDGWTADLHGYEYLEDWFTESVLVQIWAILQQIEQVESDEVRLILEIVLSNLLRDASLQDSGDLRTRRADSPPANTPVVPKFIATLDEHIDSVAKAKDQIQLSDVYQRAVQADTRELSESLFENNDISDDQLFDGAITSPPYATALPYVDTHRLSLMLFGYIEPGEFRETDRSLIGTRNITTTSRRDLYDEIESNQAELPSTCISLCRELKSAVDPEEDGFRRQNKPALVYRYLKDMKASLSEVRKVLRASGRFAMIVGPNTTKLGGKEYTIDNPDLLAELGEQVGYTVEHNVELEAHHRFGMHNTSHAINTENLLLLRK